AVGAGDGDLAAAGERRGALDVGDLVLLHEELDTLRVLGAHAARALHGHAVVELHLADGDAELPGVPDLDSHCGGLEQRLGGNAAPEHAGAAERLTLDDGGGEAELGAADGANVAGGAAADEDHVEGSHKI